MAQTVAKVTWRVLGLVSGLAAAAVTRKVLETAWRKTRGGEPPRNPAPPGTTWTEAVSWAAASGLAVAVARLVSARGAAATWHKATGTLPPGVEEVGA